VSLGYSFTKFFLFVFFLHLRKRPVGSSPLWYFDRVYSLSLISSNSDIQVLKDTCYLFGLELHQQPCAFGALPLCPLVRFGCILLSGTEAMARSKARAGELKHPWIVD